MNEPIKQFDIEFFRMHNLSPSEILSAKSKPIINPEEESED